MMAKKAKEYRRLPGRSGNLVGYSTLWLGADHLLSLTQTSFSEQCKRFYFRDVQAITLRKTVRGKMWNIILSGLTGLFTLIAMRPNEAAFVLGGMCAVIFFFSFLIHWLRGPTCVSHLRTAVQTEKLPSLSRIRTASKAISILKPRIEEAQGRLTPEEIQAKAAEIPQMAVPPGQHGIGATRTTQQTKYYTGRLHEIAFYLLLLSGLLTGFKIFHNDIAITLVGNAVFLGLVVFVVFALIKQHDTGLRDEVRWVTWGTLGYLFASLYFSLIYFRTISVNAQNPVINMWEMIQELSALSYLDSPFLLAFSIFSIVSTLALGICGIWYLTKSRRAWMVPHPRSVIPPG